MASYTIGLDLGQARDFTAIAVVERIELFRGNLRTNIFGDVRHRFEDRYEVRHLERIPLRTSYPQVVERVSTLFNTEELQDAVPILDATGVGRAVVDMFRESFREGRLGRYWPVAVTITSGEKAHALNVPKTDLISNLLVLLENDRLRIAESLRFADHLMHELPNFRAKTTAKGNRIFEARKESDHDDLVLALSLACWYKNRQAQPRIVDLAPRMEV